MPRSDPIRDRYYKSVERAYRATEALFYAGALLSFGSVLVNQETFPRLYENVLILFVLDVASFFVLGMLTRFYFTPRAEQKRRQDFLTHAFGVSLTYENTVDYYNNDFGDASKKLGAQVLENSFFSKELVRRAAYFERIRTVGYFIVWSVLLVSRRTDYGVVLAATQAVFSEQILSKLIRLEWFRAKCEKVHDDVYRLFQSSAAVDKFLPMALESLLLYETAKSNAGIVIPSGLFHRANRELSAQWQEIRSRLNL